MKINVDRTVNAQGNLVFTITVSDPQVAPFTDEERICLEGVDAFTKNMSKTIDPNGMLYQDILKANHHVKEKVFMKVLENLKFSIENELRPKFRPICQEIYNWIFDLQQGFLKTWMSEFDPQRTTYYFDNDGKNAYCRNPNEISDDKVEDKDEDDDED